MEDITGKKFSLQDWVMRRAANQSGSIAPSISIRHSVAMTDHETNMAEETIQSDMRSVSNGAMVRSHDITHDTSSESHESHSEASPEAQKAASTMEPAYKINPSQMDADTSLTSPATKDTSKTSAASMGLHAASGGAIQQLQIVRLLTDLGERLRQSEKEREVLWKEVESCRKKIAEMDGRGDKSDKAQLSLESQIKDREHQIASLLYAQATLEEKIAQQAKDLEESREEQDKLEEKISSIETATGSAIVRVEDAVAENQKLAKRVEALGQDKARLLHKLELMEDTLAQTQESLKAKALVLLTDHAIASRTNLPQAPAWTGNDTLKVSRPAVAASQDGKATQSAAPIMGNPAADLAASLAKKPSAMRINTILLAAIILLGIVGGVVVSKYNLTKLLNVDSPAAHSDDMSQLKVSSAKAVADVAEQAAKLDAAPEADKDQEMAKIASLANQIEPGSLSTDEAAPSASKEIATPSQETLSEPSDFDVARIAEEKAVAEYKAEDWSAQTIAQRFTADKTLPAIVKEIEAKALAGEGPAQHDMAVIYTSGQGGVKVNYAKAIKWFDEAAHNGVANAQYNLGVLYHQGMGVTKDLNRAVQLYRVAAAAGHPEAQYNMAIAYIDGVGAESNPQVAAIYFERAAEGGVIEAAYNLGLLHENGLLGESQPDEAVFWYSLAASKGNPDAKKSLESLKTQLSMQDEDVKRLVARIGKTKANFLDDKGEIAMPEPRNMRPKFVDSGVSKSTDSKSVAGEKVSSGVAAAGKAQSALFAQVAEQLARLNLYQGLPEGKNSAALENAIKSYQEKNNLTVDGKATEDLLVKLLASNAQDAFKE